MAATGSFRSGCTWSIFSSCIYEALPSSPSTRVCCLTARFSLRNGWIKDSVLLTENPGPALRCGRKEFRGQRNPFALFTDVSSRAVSTGSNFESIGTYQMTTEERDAIMAFEGLTGQAESDETQLGMDISSEASVGSPNSFDAVQSSSPTSVEDSNEIRSFEASEDSNISGLLNEVSDKPKEKGPKVVKRHTDTIRHVITIFIGLLNRPFPVSSARMMAASGGTVLEKVEFEVKKMQGAVEDAEFEQCLFEILRVVKLLQMDLQTISAARKSDTFAERIRITRSHCQELINIGEHVIRTYAI